MPHRRQRHCSGQHGCAGLSALTGGVRATSCNGARGRQPGIKTAPDRGLTWARALHSFAQLRQNRQNQLLFEVPTGPSARPAGSSRTNSSPAASIQDEEFSGRGWEHKARRLAAVLSEAQASLSRRRMGRCRGRHRRAPGQPALTSPRGPSLATWPARRSTANRTEWR